MVNGRTIVTFGLILLCLIALSTFYLQSVKAQFQGDITINSDGSITQPTMLVQKVADIYFLTTDISGQSIAIKRSDTIFDGNNHTLTGNTLYVLDVSNVTVRNLTFANSYKGISIGTSSGVTIANDTFRDIGSSLPFSASWAISMTHGNDSKIIECNFIDNMGAIFFGETFNNSIISNNISNSDIAFAFYGSPGNTIYNNNFFNNSINFQDQGLGLYPYNASTIIWNNGAVGNYWSDYTTKYPNATEVDSSGIGNTPYVIDQNNVDNYPLIQQANSNSTPSVPELSWLVILPLLFSVLAVAVVFRHRKTANSGLIV